LHKAGIEEARLRGTDGAFRTVKRQAHRKGAYSSSRTHQNIKNIDEWRWHSLASMLLLAIQREAKDQIFSMPLLEHGR
jgi:hypothetical protein